MPIHGQAVLRILSEATEPLFASEIAERLNLQRRPAVAYTTIEVGRVLHRLHEQGRAARRWALDAETIAALTSLVGDRGERHGNITSSLLPSSLFVTFHALTSFLRRKRDLSASGDVQVKCRALRS